MPWTSICVAQSGTSIVEYCCPSHANPNQAELLVIYPATCPRSFMLVARITVIPGDIGKSRVPVSGVETKARLVSSPVYPATQPWLLMARPMHTHEPTFGIGVAV